MHGNSSSSDSKNAPLASARMPVQPLRTGMHLPYTLVYMSHSPADSAPCVPRLRRWSSDDYRPLEARAACTRLFSEAVVEVIREPAPVPVRNPFRVRFELHTLGPITLNFAESN